MKIVCLLSIICYNLKSSITDRLPFGVIFPLRRLLSASRYRYKDGCEWSMSRRTVQPRKYRWSGLRKRWQPKSWLSDNERYDNIYTSLLGKERGQERERERERIGLVICLWYCFQVPRIYRPINLLFLSYLLSDLSLTSKPLLTFFEEVTPQRRMREGGLVKASREDKRVKRGLAGRTGYTVADLTG